MRSTLDVLFLPLMQVQSIKLDHCAICGRRNPLNQHHIVRRGAGKLFRDGREQEKPTITLCGVGNHLPYCHGLAHHQRLHFRADKAHNLEYLITPTPTKYLKALGMDGWRRVRC